MNQKEKIELINDLKNQKIIQYPLNFFKYWDIDRVRKIYKIKIDRILKDLYSKYLNENGKIVNVPNEEKEYSFLNYLNTHYIAFAIIVNWINKEIVNSAKENKLIATRQLNFKEDKSNWEEEIKSALFFMDKYKYNMFLPENELYEKLKKAVSGTIKKGYESEKKMVEFIKKSFPDATNFISGGHGQKNDMVKGIDLTFTLNNKKVKVQHKLCKNVNEQKFYYFVNGVGGIKNYDFVDCLSFEDRYGNLFLFKNKNVKVFDNKIDKSFMIPKENLIKKS